MKQYQEKPKLSSFTIKGFKSIRNLDQFVPSAINIFIGPNGVGKSNLIGFFRLISWSVKSPNSFQDHILRLGRASGILFNGIKTTSSLEGEINITTTAGINSYQFRLSLVGTENLAFTLERLKFTNPKIGLSDKEKGWTDFGYGHNESKLLEFKSENKTVNVISNLLRMLNVYQFHDTSENAEIRQAWNVFEGRLLLEKGQNLGSFLYNIRENYSKNYLIIIEHIRAVLPDFQDFVLEPQGNKIELKWREKDSSYLFSSFQASDGTLRFWCLVALLSQPYQNLPAVLFIDEPELGLHPEAIIYLSGLIKKASAFSQIFISTQSPELVNQFSANDVIVVEKKNKESLFKRLNEDDLKQWLASYSLSELWKLNLLSN